MFFLIIDHFLRFHKRAKYGDDLTNTRLDFKHVNETKKIVRGFAQGRTAHAFRNVYPIFDANDSNIYVQWKFHLVVNTYKII